MQSLKIVVLGLKFHMSRKDDWNNICTVMTMGCENEAVGSFPKSYAWINTFYNSRMMGNSYTHLLYMFYQLLVVYNE